MKKQEIKKLSKDQIIKNIDKFKTGDKVSIIESKPFSKNKKFQVMENTK